MPQSREFEIIERYFTRTTTDSAIRVGIGDDAAVVEAAGSVAIAVDTLVAGTHFPAGLAAKAIGHRSLAVNLSDLAAVAARPRFATLALTLPAVDESWIEAFAAGFFELAERHGVSLIGGDTTRGPLSVTVQLIGELAGAPLLRSGGQVGDRVFVSGSLGASAAGLACFGAKESEQTADAIKLIERFSFPEPRVALGLSLAGLAHAAIDISDGLVADLGHICAMSNCGAVIALDEVPMGESLRALYPGESGLEFALHGGDDYELCFTVAPADAGRVSEVAAECATPVTEIGELRAETGITGRHDGKTRVLEAQGFVHFS
jgi:thiamine-monophosphate kinase